MLMTDGLIFATRAATSGVPGKRGGVAKGAGIGVSGSAGDFVVESAASAPDGYAVCALAVGDCRWQPAANARGSRTTGRLLCNVEKERICPRNRRRDGFIPAPRSRQLQGTSRRTPADVSKQRSMPGRLV